MKKIGDLADKFDDLQMYQIKEGLENGLSMEQVDRKSVV